MNKVKAFIALQPETPVIIIGPAEYEVLRKRYKNLVAWEGK
jgi:hypothetical protein